MRRNARLLLGIGIPILLALAWILGRGAPHRELLQGRDHDRLSTLEWMGPVPLRDSSWEWYRVRAPYPTLLQQARDGGWQGERPARFSSMDGTLFQRLDGTHLAIAPGWMGDGPPPGQGTGWSLVCVATRRSWAARQIEGTKRWLGIRPSRAGRSAKFYVAFDLNHPPSFMRSSGFADGPSPTGTPRTDPPPAGLPPTDRSTGSSAAQTLGPRA